MAAAVRCDECGKFTEAPPSTATVGPRSTLPPDWVYINVWQGHYGTDRACEVFGDFCSIVCGGAYLLKHAASCSA